MRRRHYERRATRPAEASAVSAARAAWLSSGVAVLTGLISLTGALYSADKAAETASKTTSMQSSAERKAFLRDQREKRYDPIMAHLGSLRDQEIAVDPFEGLPSAAELRR